MKYTVANIILLIQHIYDTIGKSAYMLCCSLLICMVNGRIRLNSNNNSTPFATKSATHGSKLDIIKSQAIRDFVCHFFSQDICKQWQL